jgi:hypothetical protein
MMIYGRAAEKRGAVLAKVSRHGASPNSTVLRPIDVFGSPFNPALARPLERHRRHSRLVRLEWQAYQQPPKVGRP